MIKIKILLIDDAEDEQFLLQDELYQQAIKAEIFRVDTGQAMIEALSSQHFDLLLLDYVMPGFSAPKAIELYHEMRLDLPLIVMSGQIGEDIAVEMMRAGAHDYISKQNRVRLIPAIKRELSDYQQRVEKRQTEKHLSELENRNDLILKTTGSGIFGLDLQIKHTFVNPAAAQILGYEISELIGLKSHSTWHYHYPDGSDYPEKQCPICKTMSKNEAHQGEEYFIRKDGTFFPALYYSMPMIKDGQVIGAVVSFSDISDQKHVQENLLKTNRSLTTLSECNQILIRADNEKKLLNDICRVLHITGNYNLIWISFRDKNKQLNPLVWQPENNDITDFLTPLKNQYNAKEYESTPEYKALYSGTTIIERKTLINNDIVWAETEKKPDIKTWIALPLFYDKKVFAVLNVLSESLDDHFSSEVALLEELAGDIAFGLNVIRTQSERDKFQQDLHQSLLQTIKVLGDATEKRDPYTSGHQLRVSQLSVLIAQHLDLDQHKIEGIRLGAMIHDIGKIYVPAEILNRPGKLTTIEFEMIKEHVQASYEIIKDIDFPWPLANMIWQHHERLDGSGYPNGLKTNEIIIEAKILAVADVVEAITNHRPYRPSLGLDHALNEIRQGVDRLYDKSVVDTCFDIINNQGLPW
ncbi:MAG: HD domain-containing protein [gamma proteobacterium symbiont of Taylorina sp.]|nr:HD domain-containing protein [gamma proteobacterium symbiont of Taylorina sp.]